MKYELSIEIDLPLNDVADAFSNPNQLADWQRGFISIESTEGEPGKEGSKSEIKYQMGKRKIDMIETITQNDLPDAFSAIYEAKGVWNLQENTFIKISESKTRWTSRSEFIMQSFTLKLFAVFMPRMFKKQSYQYMTDFKAWAENEESVRS